MADDFVNNFGLLGQVLFKKRNEREARQRLDEALSRELAKIAAQAGYEKEMVDTRERGAKERAEMGETGARERQAHELALREKLAQDARQAEIDSQGRDFLTRLGSIKTEYNAKGELNEADWKREEANRRKAQEIAERNSYAQYLQSLALYGRDNDIAPELLTLGNIPAGKTNVPAGTKLSPDGSARRGRFSVSKPDGTPPKPGETPRTPNNAAPEIPVQVGPKPLSADASRELTGPSLADAFSDASLYAFRGKGGMRVVEEYMRGLQGNKSYIPPEWGELRLDELSKDLGYDQRRPAIKK